MGQFSGHSTSLAEELDSRFEISYANLSFEKDITLADWLELVPFKNGKVHSGFLQGWNALKSGVSKALAAHKVR